MGDIRYGEPDPICIKLIYYLKKRSLSLIVPQFVIFAERNQIRGIKIYQILIAEIKTSKECPKILRTPLYVASANNIKVVIQRIQYILVKVNIANRNVEIAFSIEPDHAVESID